MRTAVLLKRVDLRPVVDPLTGDLVRDQHGGLSAADLAALELAVRTGGDDVLAVTAGPPDADAVLREALAAGATSAVRVELDPAVPSAAVAASLAPLVAGRHLVWCGDHSLDRGSGSVPAFVAGHLGAAQVLGVVSVTVSGEQLELVRRLDRGRRETVLATPPAVLSVEAGAATPRRPSLAAVLAARTALVTVLPAPAATPEVGLAAAYRPRARVLPGPDPALPPRERLVALSGALTEREPPRVVRAEPDEAAAEVLRFLAARGLR